MATKGLILLGLGLFSYFALSQAARALERGVRQYLQRALPGARVVVHVDASPFWFTNGSLERISIQLSRFEASQFPIPTVSSLRRIPSIVPTLRNRPQAESTGTPAAPEPGGGGTTQVPSSAPPTVQGAGPSGAPKPESQPLPPQPPVEKIRWATIRNLNIQLADFSFHQQHVEGLTAHIPDVRYNFGRARSSHTLELGGSEVGTVDTVLSEEDLNQAITFDRTEIRNLRIHPEPGHLRITLEYHTIVAWVPVTVTTRLRIVDGHAIYFSSPAITAVSVSLPQAVSDYIIKRVQALNPIFDLNRLDLPMDVDLTAAESVQGRLLVHGTIRIPDY